MASQRLRLQDRGVQEYRATPARDVRFFPACTECARRANAAARTERRPLAGMRCTTELPEQAVPCSQSDAVAQTPRLLPATKSGSPALHSESAAHRAPDQPRLHRLRLPIGKARATP